MFARWFEYVHDIPGLRSMIAAYGAVMAASAGITLMILINADVTTVPPWSMLDVWAVIAGATSAGAAFFFARHWIGGAGVLGFARASVGMVIVTLATGLVAGTLIAPGYGTLAGPFMLVSAFIVNPLLAIAWAVVHFGAHLLIAVRRQVKNNNEFGSSARAVTQLSAISQANLYGR
ncbi:hypothetical protein DFP92_101434 [Yoonia sediminilitoris]|uniref:Uncharacterized protein n=2 Tax=Yoonia sediminilitoris TaxID=1286148 RepID=A0A2T6KQN5_9RHOB|nr:hypothetical protein C8N45_101434 [Yoonia sediminilitoris]RCW99013.1 hypothetical protein DFP92_101434 [Yoonia sediminilitoris]